MTGYEEFQQIMAELNRKKRIAESGFDLPRDLKNFLMDLIND